MTQSNPNFDQFAKQAAESSKANMEALAQAGNAYAKGFESIFKTYISLAQDAAEKNSQALKTLMGCKTIHEFTETQSQIASENLNDFLNNFSTLSEMSVKVATDAFEPINEQFSENINKAANESKKAAKKAA